MLKKYRVYIIRYQPYVSFKEDDRPQWRRLYHDKNGSYIRFKNEIRYISDDEIYKGREVF